MTTIETPPVVGEGLAAPAPPPPRVPPSTQRPPEPAQPEAAQTAYPETDIPFIDFDEEGARIIARTRIGGEVFDVPPMPAAAMAWYVKLQGTPLDDEQKAMELITEFIVRCFAPADQERVRAALSRSPVSLHGLMQKGGELMMASSGIPRVPPSSPSPGGLWTDGGISTVSGSAPGTPG